MKNLDILKRHNAHIARRRQRKSSQLSDDEITKNNLEDHEENTNSVSCISHLSVDEIEMQQLKDEKIPLFTSKHVGETDIISRQALWLEKKELRIRDTLKKQEEEFLKDLSFNPDFGNNTYSWERAKRQSEREQERFVQRERQRESKRELYRLQEELVSQTTLFGGLNTSSAILLSPIDPAVTTTIKKKKKKKLQHQQQELSDKDFIANMTNDSQRIYQDYLAPLSAPEMQKTIPITRSTSAEKRHRNNNKNSNNNNNDTSSPAISSPYYSRSQRNPKKQANSNDFADLDEFQIDLKQFNKMGVGGVHSITQKDITDAQHWFAKLMRERKDIESSTDEINSNLYEKQQQTQMAETPPPLIPKRKKLKPGQKKKQSSSITKNSSSNNSSNNNNHNYKVGGRIASNNNPPETNSSRNDRDSSSNSDINQYNQSLQLQYNDESDFNKSTIDVSEAQEGQLQEGVEEDYDEEDEYGDITFNNNDDNGMTSFFHESSTAEKGRHQVLEPLAFDSSSITRRVDNQNSYVSFLVGHLRDSNTRKYEIITIVFDKNHFNESTAEKWWLANEQRVRKDIEK